MFSQTIDRQGDLVIYEVGSAGVAYTRCPIQPCLDRKAGWTTRKNCGNFQFVF